MKYQIAAMTLLVLLLFSVAPPPACGQDLATASPAQLLQVYHQLRSLQGSKSSATVGGVVFKRDAATFTFSGGALTFAAPVAGRVVAAVFRGNGAFELDPPTAIEQHQIARFSAGQPKLVEPFESVVFFFTDDSYAALEKVTPVRSIGNSDAAMAELHEVESRYQDDFNGWWSNQTKGNPIICNLAARMLADLSDPQSKGFFLADIQSRHSGNFIFVIDRNRGEILFPGSDDNDDEMLIHRQPGQSYEWWAGFDFTAGDAVNSALPTGTRYIHCTNETIDATLSVRNSLSATVQMDFQVERGAPRVLPFNLNPVLRISSISEISGTPLSFIQEPRNEDSDPWVILPAPAKPGAQYAMTVAYQENSDEHSRIVRSQGQDIQGHQSALFYVAPEESWYPHFGRLGDWTTFNSTFHLAKGSQLIGPGDPVTSKGRNTTEWKTPAPFNTAGFIFGALNGASKDLSGLTVVHYAPFGIPSSLSAEAYHQAQEQVAQMANTAIGEPRVGAWGINPGENPAAAANMHVSECYAIHQPGPIADQATSLFQFFFGPLDVKRLSVISTPFWGAGMVWPMAEVVPFNPLADPATLTCLNAAGGSPFFELPMVGAVAHQWWGGQVQPATYHDVWLFDGLRELSDALYVGQFDTKHWAAFWDALRSSLLTEAKDGRRLVDAGPVWLGDQVDSHGRPRAATALDSEKGAYVLQTLRMLMQNPKSKDPDAAFIAMMQDFSKTYAGRDASTADFEKIVEKHVGQSMGWFFDEWVYGTAVPHYDFKYNLSAAPGGKTQLTMTIAQSSVPDTFRMLVPIYVTLPKGTFELAVITMKGPTTVNPHVLLPFRPLKVELDATRSILCTISQ